MSEEPKSIHSARSRAPIDNVAAKWWEEFGVIDTKPLPDASQETLEPKFKHKSTNTITFPRQKEVTYKLNQSKDPKDIVLKKWQEDKAKMNYEKARKALINSLKEKFRYTDRTNTNHAAARKKDDICEADTRIEMIEDNVEGSSNSNVNHKESKQRNMNLVLNKDRVDIKPTEGEDVSHARIVRMESGGEVAQWRLAPHGSRAAGAEGGLRGRITEDMPVSLALN